MSKLIIVFICLSFALFTYAGNSEVEKNYNFLTFKQIDVQNIWLQSGNAAGLSQMPSLFPSEIKAGFDYTSGNFHSVFSGNKNQSYNFSSQSFRKINQTFLYGAMSYNRDFEKGLNYSNTNTPGLNYPYLLADTIGKDTYDREFFSLKGALSFAPDRKINSGLSFDYQVGTASQDRDPRPENKIVQANVSAGLIAKTSWFRFGANLMYGYYNEDIDVSVVQDGIQITMFQLHGPGAFTYHSSNSFFRLYTQNKLGGGLQFELNKGLVSNILNSSYHYFYQTIDDGRKGSMATWAAVKNDAELDGIDWDLCDILSITRGTSLHILKAKFRLTNKLGTEFIQRLEKTGDADQEQWVTYGKDQRYYSLRTLTDLNYQVLTKDENSLMKSLFQVGISYNTFGEDYYSPNQEVKYSDFQAKSSFLKLAKLNQAMVSAEIELSCKYSISSRQSFAVTNFVTNKINTPEYNYQTKDYISTGIHLGFQIPVKNVQSKYFSQARVKWFGTSGKQNQLFFGLSTGLIF